MAIGGPLTPYPQQQRFYPFYFRILYLGHWPWRRHSDFGVVGDEWF